MTLSSIFLDVNWGSSTQAHSYSSALKAMLELNRVEEHVKNFRPQVLVLTGMPGSRPPLVDFAYLITKGLSLLVCANILKVSNAQWEEALEGMHSGPREELLGI